METKQNTIIKFDRDKEKLQNFMSFLGTMDLPNLRTKEGKSINQLIDGYLRMIITEIGAEMEQL